MNIQIKPLTIETLDDYLWFFDNMVFDENPDWSACYCFSFHFTGSKEEWQKEKNRQSVIDFVKEGKMTGYLAYLNNRPVGWCNTNDRNQYQRLLKYYDLVNPNEDKICSIVCFLIHPEYRRQGIAQQILNQISSDYSSQNYKYIEAYPGKGDFSCEGHYRGPLQLYHKNNFTIIKEYDDYYVMRKKL
ncbi:GNAT family N-acetyltransferase [Carboxylicivirga linearis]|uniref:GNAT family N-acetyltransferase n=1 Tax=Carboxylicivirga linearis TaxID=1628157 RepID=A0ABS5K1M0_9BACT|nr:GNAT family N-acetyltransferase [Carboxylicivirga linearis]MBS2101018.1 GNAT family N-acetyltransferase [Carboxylicivirga linearis]